MITIAIDFRPDIVRGNYSCSCGVRLYRTKNGKPVNMNQDNHGRLYCCDCGRYAGKLVGVCLNQTEN